MNTIDICSKLEKTTYLVCSYPKGQDFLDPEACYGIGSGVVINSRGYLLTAAHVIAGELPVPNGFISNPDLIIQARTQAGNIFQYQCVLCGIQIVVENFRRPLTIDLALLRPIYPQENIPFLKLCEKPVKTGTHVVMAGYPEDMETPFSFEQSINFHAIPNSEEFQKHLYWLQSFLMMKGGMVGRISQIKVGKDYHSQFLYIDNEMHSGGSGGPVVNQNAEIVGIVTQRAVISLSIPPQDIDDPKSRSINFQTPSGSAVAISTLGFLDYAKIQFAIDI